MNERPRCLVEAGWGIGDRIAATPCARALYLLGFDVDLFMSPAGGAPDVASLCEGLPWIRRVIAAPRELRAGDYELGVSCLGQRHAATLLPPGQWYQVSRRAVMREGIYAGNLVLARELGYDGPIPTAEIVVDASDPDIPERSVVVHCGCTPGRSEKRWGGWERICEHVRGMGFHVILVGTEADLSGRGWESRFERRFSLSFPRLAGLLTHAYAYLGNDSGVGHMAGAVGTPGLLLFGPSSPERYGPNSDALRVLAAEVLPGEVRQPELGRRVPIDRLGFEAVRSAVEEVLADARRAPPRVLPARRDAPRGDPAARLATRAEVTALPATLDALDDAFRRLAADAILGLLARRGDASASAQWRRAIAESAALVHLRAAEIRGRTRTVHDMHQAGFHLHEAGRAGAVWRARLSHLKLLLGPRPVRDRVVDPFRQ